MVLSPRSAVDARIFLSSTLESLEARGGGPSESESLEDGLRGAKSPPSVTRREELQKAWLIRRAFADEVLMTPVTEGKT